MAGGNPFYIQRIFNNITKGLTSSQRVSMFPAGFYSPSDNDYIRLYRIREFWKLYSSEEYVAHFNETEKQKKERHYYVNYGKAMINKTVMFTAGEPFRIESPEGLEAIGHICNNVWEANNRGLTSFQMFQMGAVSGDCFVKIAYDDKATSMDDLEKVRLIVLPSDYIYVKWDAQNPDRIVYCEIHTLIPRSLTKLKYDKSKNYTDEFFVRHIEQITPEKIVEWLDYDEKTGSSRENFLGEVPIVHIPNITVNQRFWGVSDWVDIIDIQDMLNELDSTVRNIIKYHEQPTTLIFGAKASKLEKSFNKVWSGLPEKAKVENLILDSDLPASSQFKSDVMANLYDISDIPEGMRGKLFPISNTSAAALEMMFFPAVIRSKQKRLFYEPGIKKINYFILKYLETKIENFKLEDFARKVEPQKDTKDLTPMELVNNFFKRSLYRTDVKWQSILPKDKQRQIEVLGEKLRMNIITRKKALQELGEKNVEQLLGEVDEEFEKLERLRVRIELEEQERQFSVKGNLKDDYYKKKKEKT